MGLFSKGKVETPYIKETGPGDFMNQYMFGGSSQDPRTMGVTDPNLQGRILGAEALYRPQYTGLELSSLSDQLYGLKAGRVNPEIEMVEAEIAKYKKISKESMSSARRAGRGKARKRHIADAVEADELLKEAEAKLVDLPKTIKTATPGLFALQRASTQQAGVTQRSEEALQRASDVGALEKYAPQVVEAYRAADPYSTGLAEQATDRAQLQDASAAEQQLQEMGMSLSDLSPTEQEALISQRGMEFAASTGELTFLEQRRAQQSARQASLARGRARDQSALYEEMQSRMAQEMNKQEREVAMGSQLLGQQAGLRGARLGQGAGMLANSEVLATQRRGEYTQNLQQAFEMNRLMAGDQGMAILGRPTNSMNQGSMMMQSAQGMPTGPGLFDMNAGVNYGMQNQANQMGLQGAQAQAGAARSAGMSNMFGQIGAAFAPQIASGLGTLATGIGAKLGIGAAASVAAPAAAGGTAAIVAI